MYPLSVASVGRLMSGTLWCRNSRVCAGVLPPAPGGVRPGRRIQSVHPGEEGLRVAIILRQGGRQTARNISAQSTVERELCSSYYTTNESTRGKREFTNSSRVEKLSSFALQKL